MRHPQTCSTPEGGSRFEDVEVELTPVAFVPGNPPLDLAAPRTATVAQFAVLAPGWDGSWHTASTVHRHASRRVGDQDNRR
jgi:hypothetical protein